MANVSLHQLLGSPTVTAMISRIKTPMSRFQDFFGMNPGGSAVQSPGGDKFGWDIMDTTRALAKGRPPSVGPASSALQPIAHQTASAYRAHEKILLLESRIFRNRPLGSNWGTVEPRGQRYVLGQERILAQKFRNNREFMVSRMMRGGFDVLISGDDWIPVELSAGNMSIDFKIPAGNKSQLDLLGAGDIIGTSWALVATADIFADVMDINSAFEQLHGYPVRHVWMNSTGIRNVFNNTKLQGLTGTANRVFTTFAPTGLRSPEGIEDTGFTVVFGAIPWLTWHVYDAGLDVNGTYTKFIPDDVAVFMPDPSPAIAEWYEGSEIVAENVMDPGTERYGLAAWSTRVIDPAGFELKALDVGLPVLYLPKAIAYATVVF